ncbi:MAG: NUDIX domain-containing protein, partial [Candidatus Diapherotrites archaeon]
MKLEGSFVSKGVKCASFYEDCDEFPEPVAKEFVQVYGVCFLEKKIALVRNRPTGRWNLPGGTHEKGESVGETFCREIREETNCQVISWKPIGFQKVVEEGGNSCFQLRVAAIVKKLGEFE